MRAHSHSQLLDLSAAVDVYGEWVDAAGMYRDFNDDLDCNANPFTEAVAKADNAAAGYAGTARSRRATGNRTADEDDDDRRSYEGEGIVADDY